MKTTLLSLATATTLFSAPALADERVLILSAYAPEGAVLLQAAGVDGPEDQIASSTGGDSSAAASARTTSCSA